MSQEIETKIETKSTSLSGERISDRKMSLGLVLKVPFSRAEDVEAQIENLFGEMVFYLHWDSAPLFISRRDPRERGDE